MTVNKQGCCWKEKKTPLALKDKAILYFHYVMTEKKKNKTTYAFSQDFQATLSVALSWFFFNAET